MQKSIEHGNVERFAQVETLQHALHEMRNNVAERINARQTRALDAHNAPKSIIFLRFVIGDYVLVCKPTHREHKLALLRCEPRRVVAVTSPPVCVVEDLTMCEREKLHASHLKKYNALLDCEEVPGEVLYLASRTSAKYEVVEQIIDIAKNGYGSWLQFSGKASRTSETTYGLNWRIYMGIYFI